MAGEQDLARRRELSRAHLLAADEKLSGGDDPATRALALHELGSALALDPDNNDARGALLRLLTAPPRVTPAEVKRRLEENRVRQRRTVARLRATTSLTFFGLAPLAWFIGVREPNSFLLALLMVALASLANVAIWRQQRPSSALEYFAAALYLGAQLWLARIAGPLVLMPALLVAYAVATQTHPLPSHRRIVTAAACCVLAIGFLLEVSGFVDRSYALTEGGVFVHEHMMRIDVISLWFFFAASLATIVMPSLFAARTRAAQTRAEESLHMQTWQLERLVSRDDVPVASPALAQH